jgi:hypothetical protein
MSKTNDERAHDLWIRTLGNEIQSPLPVSEALAAAEQRGFERGRAEGIAEHEKTLSALQAEWGASCRAGDYTTADRFMRILNVARRAHLPAKETP